MIRVQTESQHLQLWIAVDLVGSHQHGVASYEVISCSTDIHILTKMVMTSDGTQIQIFASWPMSRAKRVTRDNRPFYSCVLSYLAMNASEVGVELALIQTSLFFSCKCKLVSIRTT